MGVTCKHRNRSVEARVTGLHWCGRPASEYRLTRWLPPHAREYWAARLCDEHMAYYTGVCRWTVAPAALELVP